MQGPSNKVHKGDNNMDGTGGMEPVLVQELVQDVREREPAAVLVLVLLEPAGVGEAVDNKVPWRLVVQDDNNAVLLLFEYMQEILRVC